VPADARDLVVRWPRPADEADVRAAVVELAAEGFDFALGLEAGVDFASWCDDVRAHARGERLRPGWVPATSLVAVLDGHVVGRVHVRHELTPFLREVGGHIGYGVRPRWRRRGVATALLRVGLDVLAALGVEEALVTCDDDNRASAAVIERAGGRLVGTTLTEDLHKRRYLVPTG
jgi:predicted acetyltransferase